MTDTSPSFGARQNSAVKADGFVDYYELIHEDPESTVTRLRTAINTLYNEAQANRDHRNLNKRRTYQELLDLLPQAREFLLDEELRRQYDNYREEALNGLAKQDFTEWQTSVRSNGEDAESASLLGVQEEEQRLRGQEVRAQVLKVAKEKKPRSRVVVEDAPQAIPTGASPALLGSAISAIVFFAVLAIAVALFKTSLPAAILIGAILAIIVWVFTHLGKGKIKA